MELLVYRPFVPVKDFFATECFGFVEAFLWILIFLLRLFLGLRFAVLYCLVSSIICHSLEIISSSRDTLTIDRHKALNSPLNDESNPLDQEYKIVVYFVHLSCEDLIS